VGFGTELLKTLVKKVKDEEKEIQCGRAQKFSETSMIMTDLEYVTLMVNYCLKIFDTILIIEK